MFYLLNMSYSECCCNLPPNSFRIACTLVENNTKSCWLPPTMDYPCDSIVRFKTFLVDYIEERIQPVAGVALFLCLLQLFTSITACCNQCAGKKQSEKEKIAGPMAYDGLYAEGEDYAGGNAYDAYAGYVKSGTTGRPGSAAAVGMPGVPGAPAGGAGAPRAPAPGAALGQPRSLPPRAAPAPGGPRPAKL